MLFLSMKLFCVEKYRQTTGLFVHKKIKWGWKSIQSHNQLCNMYSIRIDYSWLFSNTNPLFLCKCLGVSLIRINSFPGKKNKIYLTNTVISIIIILVIIIFTIAINVTAYIINSIFFSHWYQFHSPGFLWTVARLPDLLLTVLTVMQLGSSENALIVNKTLPGVSFKLMRQWKTILINIYWFLYHWKVRTITLGFSAIGREN